MLSGGAALVLEPARRGQAGARAQRVAAERGLPGVARDADRLAGRGVGRAPVAEPERDVGGDEERAAERGERAGVAGLLAQGGGVAPGALELVERRQRAQEQVQARPVRAERVQVLRQALGLADDRTPLAGLSAQHEHPAEHRQHRRSLGGLAALAQQRGGAAGELLGPQVVVDLRAAVGGVGEHRRGEDADRCRDALGFAHEQRRRVCRRSAPGHDPAAQVLGAGAQAGARGRVRRVAEQR